MRIEFTVSRNEGYTPLYQLVPVAPNQAYLLTAYVRSQDITSDSGPRLQVQDSFHSNGPNVMSETTVGTTPWHQISLSFARDPTQNLCPFRHKGAWPDLSDGDHRKFLARHGCFEVIGAGSEGACAASAH